MKSTVQHHCSRFKHQRNSRQAAVQKVSVQRAKGGCLIGGNEVVLLGEHQACRTRGLGWHFVSDVRPTVLLPRPGAGGRGTLCCACGTERAAAERVRSACERHRALPTPVREVCQGIRISTTTRGSVWV